MVVDHRPVSELIIEYSLWSHSNYSSVLESMRVDVRLPENVRDNPGLHTGIRSDVRLANEWEPS